MMRTINSIILRNLIILSRDKLRLIMTFMMSFLFLIMFSFLMKSNLSGITAIKQPYSYLITGIIVMNIFQSALNGSMNILDDLASGYMKEVIVAPISRLQIAAGQILSSTIIAVLQGLVIMVMGMFLGLHVDILHFIEMLIIMVFVALTFSAMGLYLAVITNSSTSFQLLTSILPLPITLLSGALIPTVIMPDFVKVLMYLNPLTYITSLFRYVSLQMENTSMQTLINSGVIIKVGNTIIQPYFELLFILATCLLFTFLCVKKFEKADFSSVKAARSRMANK